MLHRLAEEIVCFRDPLYAKMYPACNSGHVCTAGAVLTADTHTSYERKQLAAPCTTTYGIVNLLLQEQASMGMLTWHECELPRDTGCVPGSP